jgi:hypothetical protein
MTVTPDPRPSGQIVRVLAVSHMWRGLHDGGEVLDLYDVILRKDRLSEAEKVEPAYGVRRTLP